MRMVSESVAQRLVTMPDALAVVEDVFATFEHGHAEIFPVAQGRGHTPGARFGVKSGLLGQRGLAGLKIGTYWPDNRNRGLSNHSSTTLLLDAASGLPDALVCASHLTALRTAAADAIAIKHLARPEASSVAIVGAGHQAWFELQAVCAVRRIERVYVWSRTERHAQAFAARVRDGLDVEAVSSPLQDAIEAADIVVTVTAAKEPLVRKHWIKPGTHISAMGADAPGKQELDIELIAAATLVADVVEQSISIGEFEMAYRAGRIRCEDIRTLGSIITGRVAARQSAEQITIFDSSGMALQDLAIAAFALAAAERSNAVQLIDLS